MSSIDSCQPWKITGCRDSLSGNDLAALNCPGFFASCPVSYSVYLNFASCLVVLILSSRFPMSCCPSQAYPCTRLPQSADDTLLHQPSFFLLTPYCYFTLTLIDGSVPLHLDIFLIKTPGQVLLLTFPLPSSHCDYIRMPVATLSFLILQVLATFSPCHH